VTLTVTADGRRVVTSSEDGIVVLDARTLQPLLRRSVRAARTALSADDRTLLVGGGDGSVGFLDLVTGEIRQVGLAHTGEIADAVFTADGRRAVTAGVDGRVIVWDVAHAIPTVTLTGNAGRLAALALSRDGATLYGATDSGTIYMWDLAGSRSLDGRFDIPIPRSMDLLPPFALAPDGKSLAVADANGTVSIVDLETLRPHASFRLGAPVGALRFRSDSRLLAIGGDNGRIVLVNTRNGAVVTELPRQHRPVWALGISRDGRVMTFESDDNIIRRLSLPSGRPAGPPFVTPDGATAISIDADAPLLAVSLGGGKVVGVYDMATGRRIRTVTVDTPVGTGVGFSPDGRTLLAKDRQGRLRMWSTDSWKATTLKFTAPTGDVQALAISPDERTVATANKDGEVRLWEFGSGRPIGTPLPGVPNGTVFVAFTSDGAYLIVFTDAGEAFRWDVRPSSWARRACALAGRTLTRAEWSAALPGHDYAPACTR
jgi:WD40 repeat protein